jgi:predicted regulator of Ras-like GTPase activity (Roadblock/LC7/MglB family)
MDGILQSIRSVDGVQGSLVLNSSGKVVAYHAHAVYDGDLMAKVGQMIMSTVDSVRLLHEDWETLSASFSDGSILLRNIRAEGGGASRSAILGIIGDSRLNHSFAGVAMRVAATKLKSLLESPEGLGGTNPAALAGMQTPRPVANDALNGSSVAAQANTPTPQPAGDLASSGLTWSGVGSSTKGSNEVQAADTESSAFLAVLTKNLSAIVGPMAKIFVKESLRVLCPNRTFGRPRWEALVQEVSKQISNPGDAAQFQKAMREHL